MTGPAYAPNDAAGEGVAGSASDSLLARLSSSPAPSGMPTSQSDIDYNDANETSYYYDVGFAKYVLSFFVCLFFVCFFWVLFNACLQNVSRLGKAKENLLSK